MFAKNTNKFNNLFYYTKIIIEFKRLNVESF